MRKWSLLISVFRMLILNVVKDVIVVVVGFIYGFEIRVVNEIKKMVFKFC